LYYNGIKEVTVSDQELADFYDGSLRFELLPNQYLILKNEKGDILDKYKRDGDKTVKLKYKSFDSQILGKIKPRNQRQELLMDLLDTKIPLLGISGIAGSGKTFLTTAHALQELQKGNYAKLVILRNNIAVSGVPDLGILPGDATQKLKESCAFIGDIITDFLFESMLQQGKIEIVYLGTMRSRSISNSYILCNEAQNLSMDLAKMIITRVGENSRLVFDFDISQIDKKIFEKDNGMIAMSDCLQGHPLFGAVELDLIERSEVAKLASLIK
jgi:PhoH-like ATPase